MSQKYKVIYKCPAKNINTQNCTYRDMGFIEREDVIEVADDYFPHSQNTFIFFDDIKNKRHIYSQENLISCKPI